MRLLRLTGGGRARRLMATAAAAGAGRVSVFPASEVARLPSRWVVFSDLHVRQDSLPHCLELLRTVATEARASQAGVICLGDFWHAGAVLSTRQLNAVLGEMETWTDLRVLMIPGNHDQAMRGNPDPQLHALTPLQLAMPKTISVFSRPTLVGDSLWLPYGIDEAGVRAACAEAEQLCARAAAEVVVGTMGGAVGGAVGSGADRASDGAMDVAPGVRVGQSMGVAPGRLAAVFCHADVVGGLMNDGASAMRGVPPDAFPRSPVRAACPPPFPSPFCSRFDAFFRSPVRPFQSSSSFYSAPFPGAGPLVSFCLLVLSSMPALTGAFCPSP
jgi:hypothetical protein